MERTRRRPPETTTPPCKRRERPPREPSSARPWNASRSARSSTPNPAERRTSPSRSGTCRTKPLLWRDPRISRRVEWWRATARQEVTTQARSPRWRRSADTPQAIRKSLMGGGVTTSQEILPFPLVSLFLISALNLRYFVPKFYKNSSEQES